jgi:hypothetical protein
MVTSVWIGKVDRGKQEEALDFLKRVAAYFNQKHELKSSIMRPVTGPGRRFLFVNSHESHAAREQHHKRRDADPVWQKLMKENRTKQYFEDSETFLYEGVE